MLQLYQALLSAFFVTVILDSPFLGKKTDHRQTGMGNLICNHFMYDLNKGLSHGSKPMCLFLVLILMFIYMILLTLSALPPLSLHHLPLLSATWLCCLYPPHLPSLLVCPLPCALTFLPSVHFAALPLPPALCIPPRLHRRDVHPLSPAPLVLPRTPPITRLL